jgi:hypothetical protein
MPDEKAEQVVQGGKGGLDRRAAGAVELEIDLDLGAAGASRGRRDVSLRMDDQIPWEWGRRRAATQLAP